MSDPLVTIGVPVYQGQDVLPITLECLRTQTYQNLDVLISVDAGDQESAGACESFLRRDSRFRMHVQPSRFGWAGNTDWTMRERRGEFYIYQQHDDQVSPTYVADLVAAASRWPNAAICFADIEYTGLRNFSQHGLSLKGPPVDRALSYLEHLDCVPFRGLIRGSALRATSGLVLSDFDPFDSFGTEIRFMTELALLGEFRFVPGPTYYKRLHGKNLYLKRDNWSDEQKQRAWACLAAWMVEVIVPAGESIETRRQLFQRVVERFLIARDPWKWLRAPARHLALTHAKTLAPVRRVLGRLKRTDTVLRTVGGRWMFYQAGDPSRRAALLRTIFDRLKSARRFDPVPTLQLAWDRLEAETAERTQPSDR